MSDENRLFPDKTGWSPNIAKRKAERDEAQKELEYLNDLIETLRAQIKRLNDFMAFHSDAEPSPDLIDSVQKLSSDEASCQMLKTMLERKIKLIDEFISLATSDLH